MTRILFGDVKFIGRSQEVGNFVLLGRSSFRGYYAFVNDHQRDESIFCIYELGIDGSLGKKFCALSDRAQLSYDGKVEVEIRK